ncbi:MAG: LysR substrate-binding domain-containing protein [Chlamydiota bacterium]
MENFRLKVFRTVAQHLNFRRAAEELCLSQPAVTLQVKALEEELGVQLFDRSSAHIALTPAGRTLLQYVRRIEKLTAEARGKLAAFAGQQRGELRLGASLTIAQYILPRVLGAFQQEHPLARPVVLTRNTEHVLEALAAREVALGLIEGPALRRDVRTEVFLQDEIVLIVPAGHEWNERGVIEPEELLRERLLLRERGSGTRRVTEAALQKRGLNVKRLKIAMEFDSTEGIIAAVEAGLGVGFASLWSIGKELQVGSLRSALIRGVQITRDLSVAYPIGPEPQGMARAFLDFLRFRRDLMTPRRSRPRVPAHAAEK